MSNDDSIAGVVAWWCVALSAFLVISYMALVAYKERINDTQRTIDTHWESFCERTYPDVSEYKDCVEEFPHR